jgi:cysteinyl-tRNA synthetase
MLNCLHSFDELFAVLKDDDGPKIRQIVEWGMLEGRKNQISKDLLDAVGAQEFTDADIEKKIAEMEAARRSRDFKASDAIRAELGTLGVVVEITKDGVRWKRK